MDVQAYAMVTSLGGDAATSCAAARAGLVRSRVLDYFRIRSTVTGEEEPVIGHPVVLLTQGFEGDARLLRLVHGALADLAIQASTSGIDLGGATAYLALPPSNRCDTLNSLIADDAVRTSRLDDASPPPTPNTEAARAQNILKRAAALARWPHAPELAFVSTAGNAGGLEALHAAAIDLSSGRCQKAIVIAADSLLDAPTLNWLQVCARLKCDAFPSGLQPGEAAAALLLSAAGPSPHGRISAPALAEESASLESGRLSTGEGLARVLANADTGAPDPRLWLISDHSGESYRASELGHAIMRLRSVSDRYASPSIDYPAIAFGDTGAASALVGLIWALRAFSRGYAPSQTALVSATSEGARRAAVSVQAPNAMTMGA